MDKNLLIRLLTSSQKVILPGFGAFLHKNNDAQPIFTPFLTKDDGFLTSQVATEYEVSQDEALEMVNAFTSHIREVLKSNDKFVFEGVGSLEVDINGTLTFVMDLSKQIPPQAAAVPPVQEEAKVVPPVSEPAVQTPPRPVQFTQPQAQPRPVSPQPIAGVNRVQFSTPAQPTAQPAPQPIARPQQGVTPTIPRPQRPINPPQPQSRPIAPPTRPMVRPAAERPIEGQPMNKPQAQQPQRPQNGAPANARPMAKGPQSEPNKSQQRPLHKSPAAPRKKQKNDTWLMIAIIAAVIVIGLMIFGIITAQEVSYLE